ncbi:hypothetical protein C5B90_03035 [Haloferax sp. Atlit-12N]|uniref:hypothetical protein n=1 Tax=Haloferax sp. Atlit-12N TaxID=2077203 RepID=UPI000E24305C|nr:hypothetical protein [Haloferax sp. Atlit-12N]RDZ65356.1 hypothetical protein C5B90_03035 [Haloferax sp. Atlit-12N]
MTTELTHSRGRDKPRDPKEESPSNCPVCTTPIEGFTTSAPGSHTVVPCGCELGFVRASDLTGGNR